MLRIHQVPEGVDVITVDGMAIARECFEFFLEAANEGRVFQFVRRNSDGTVVIRSLPTLGDSN